jgi:hypothetical protein
MARFYATFDGSTISSLEDAVANGCYERKAFTGDGPALKTALVGARAALSTAAYNTTSAISAVNQNGTLGIVVPVNGMTNDGTNVSFTNLYTNAGAIWTATPRVRPTAQITTGNSTPVSPTDGGSVSATLYGNALTALGNVLNGISGSGPYGRLGINPWLTLASIYHDHEMTYFAWDDFTPGQVQTLDAVASGSASAVTVTVSWASYEFVNDSNPNAQVLVLATLADGGNNYSFNSGKIAAPGSKEVQWNVGAVVPGTYELTATVYCYDPTYLANEGAFANVIKTGVVISA